MQKRNELASVKAYLEDTYNELRYKVSWPTWSELQSSAIVVLVASVIIALIIFVMDYVFGVQNAGVQDAGFVWRGILGYIYEILGDL